MQHQGVTIEDTFAEGFRMWAARLIVTAMDQHWLQTAAQEACGYGTSVIGCDCEAAVEAWLPPDQTPDGRVGVALLMFAFKAEALGHAVANRAGQCLMTCPTTAVYDGMPEVTEGEEGARLDLGNDVRYFGDGFEQRDTLGKRDCWRIPVMDGEFIIEQTVGAVKAVAGGNFLVCGRDQAGTLRAAQRGAAAIADQRGVITPFPGGVVRCGSKVGSRYENVCASTNQAYCPTLRPQVQSKLPKDAQCVYEVVINGLTEKDVARAMRTAISAACDSEHVIAISAGNYGGKLGKIHFPLHQIVFAEV